MYEIDITYFLYLALLIPLLLIVNFIYMLWRKRVQNSFSNHDLLEYISPNRSNFKLNFKLILECLAILCLSLALANPKIGTELKTVNREGVDIVFAVDGIDQEMHGLYRRNTNLQKVLDHVKICSEFKERVIVETQTVLFKHNQDYLEEITKLCKEYGAEKHSSVISDRFGEDDPQAENRNVYTFYDENNTKLSLNKVTKDWTDEFKKRGAQINRTKITTYLFNAYCFISCPIFRNF